MQDGIKKQVILDPGLRRMEEIFSAADLERLHRVVEVVWGKDAVMPQSVPDEHRGDVFAIVSAA